MHQDYEADADWEDSLYSESSVPYSYWEIKEELESLGVESEVFSAFISISSERPSVELVKQCQEAYQVYYNSLSDYAENYCEETGLLSSVLKEFLQYIVNNLRDLIQDF